MKFVWDEEKEKINIRKHKLSFKVAARVFLDDNAYEDSDDIHSKFEERIKIVGRVGKILAVVYTEREDRHRIIEKRRNTPCFSYGDISRNIYFKKCIG